MITARIDQEFADIFDVDSQFQVYNRSHALALDHVLHHLQAVTRYGYGELHPDLRAAYGDDEASIQEQLLADSQTAIDFYQQIVLAGPERAAALLAELRRAVPYLRLSDQSALDIAT